MCYFILIACAPDAVEQARGLLRSSFHMAETSNRSLRSLLPADWPAWALSEGMCGCSLYSDPSISDPQTLEGRIERFREKHRKPKYRKQGWSETKIERAVEQIRADYRPRNRSFSGLRQDLRRTLAELVTATGSIRILVHIFRGGLETEGICAETESCRWRRFWTTMRRWGWMWCTRFRRDEVERRRPRRRDRLSPPRAAALHGYFTGL